MVSSKEKKWGKGSILAPRKLYFLQKSPQIRLRMMPSSGRRIAFISLNLFLLFPWKIREGKTPGKTPLASGSRKQFLRMD